MKKLLWMVILLVPVGAGAHTFPGCDFDVVDNNDPSTTPFGAGVSFTGTELLFDTPATGSYTIKTTTQNPTPSTLKYV